MASDRKLLAPKQLMVKTERGARAVGIAGAGIRSDVECDVNGEATSLEHKLTLSSLDTRFAPLDRRNDLRSELWQPAQ